MLEVRPEDIEKKSFEILTSKMDENRLKFYSQDELLVVKRTIHTTADFDYQNNVIFQNNALQTIKDCIQSGAMIFTDTNMALSGINKRILTGKFGIEPLCLIADEKTIEYAKKNETTRANAAIDLAYQMHEEKEALLGKKIPIVFAVGNAPTALIRINELLDKYKPDFISVTSGYGIRQDPFKKCSAFHDGVDLECNMNHVYSMLPGRVQKVVYSKKSYGNHIVLDYGHIQCLYGHLAAITVREGDEVYAGTIVGISGNTGKSTGPHLHIKITANGKSLNPTPFIAYLNKYITVFVKVTKLSLSKNIKDYFSIYYILNVYKFSRTLHVLDARFFYLKNFRRMEYV